MKLLPGWHDSFGNILEVKKACTYVHNNDDVSIELLSHLEDALTEIMDLIRLD